MANSSLDSLDHRAATPCAHCGKQLSTAERRRCSRCRSAYYCGTECQGRAWPLHKSTCARPESVALISLDSCEPQIESSGRNGPCGANVETGSRVRPMLEVRQSGVAGAGRGVFAGRRFAKDELVCFYEGLGLTMAQVRGLQITHGHRQYMLHFPGGSILGHSAPRSLDGIGQLANDACRLNVDGFPEDRPARDQALWLMDRCELYMITSAKSANLKVTLNSSGAPIVDQVAAGTHNSDRKASAVDLTRVQMSARRDIVAGEELFFSYGVHYWLSDAFLNPSSSEKLAQTICVQLAMMTAVEEQLVDGMQKCIAESASPPSPSFILDILPPFQLLGVRTNFEQRFEKAYAIATDKRVAELRLKGVVPGFGMQPQ